ncbi:ABC transporter ATP-binding protein [Candidatus Electrothrix sp.]|uniref:ABC transporter ATP-binding protein n=1 Tax=Candidatus Electrothrix sp. TaxID=2170559 RepID=UPI0040577573
MIKVEHLTRKYRDFTAVDNVSFEIGQGEIVGLLGHNGAGKTTIMKMMTGYLEPTAGNILIDELDIGKQRRKIQNKIGYLPENCPVYPEMTVLDYLEYSAALHGISQQDRPALIREAVARTALEAKATKQLSTLSRGYRQRTGVAQAILHKPDILILDEPTNGLDPTQIQHMRTLIAELAKTATVIISTHILQEVQAICDRVLIIKDGALALDAQVDGLQHSSKLLISTDGARDAALELFQSFEQVTSVTAGRDQHFELELHADTDGQATAAALAKGIHEQDWQLFALHFESRNLETVFAEISERGGAA